VAVPELDSEGLASSNRPVLRTVFLWRYRVRRHSLRTHCLSPGAGILSEQNTQLWCCVSAGVEKSRAIAAASVHLRHQAQKLR